MRYAPQLKGDPSDTLMLSPVRAETDAERVLSADQLERRSRLASGTSDPALLSLVAPESSKERGSQFAHGRSGDLHLPGQAAREVRGRFGPRSPASRHFGNSAQGRRGRFLAGC